MEQHVDESPNGDTERELQPREVGVAERVNALAARFDDLEAEVHAAHVAGDGKALKELSKALEAWSKRDQKLEQRVTSKVDGLDDRIALLTQRLETVATTVATTASGLVGREGEVAALRRRFDEQTAAVTASLTDLSRRVDQKSLVDLDETVRDVAGEARALKVNLQRLAENTSTKTDGLASSVEALARTVSAGAAAVEGGQQEIHALRTAFDELAARIDATIARVAERENEVAALGTALAEQGETLSEVRTATEASSTHVDSAVAEFRRSINALASNVTRLDEVVETGVARGFDDRIGKLDSRIEDSSLRLESLEATSRERAEHAASVESELGALRERVAARDAEAESELRDFRQSVSDLSSRLSALDDVASGETARRLEAAAAVAAEVESLARRVEALATSVAESDARGEARATEVADLGRRFDEARTRVEALIDDLRQALDTMPDSSAPDPVLVESIDAANEQTAALAARLDQLERKTGHVERAASRTSELERLLSDGARRIAAVERDQAAHATEISRIAGASDSELGRLGGEIETLLELNAESARSIERAGSRLDDLAARVDTIDRGRDTVAEQIARVSDRVDGEASALRRELQRVAEDLGACTAEVARTAEITASERLSLQQRLDALASARDEAARSQTDLAALVDDLTARVDAISREHRSGAVDAARVSELVAAEGTSLRDQLEALATTLTEQLSRRGERIEAVVSELAGRLDAIERAGVAASSEIERLATQHSSELAAVESRLEESLVAAPELRSLGLRMTHAQASAHENREALLRELARVSTQIETRLQRLESGDAATADESRIEGLTGSLVPTRGEA